MPSIRTLNIRLSADLHTYGEAFASVFPDYQSKTLYFTFSLGSFDGATRTVGGRNALLFGVDVIATIYGPTAKLSVLGGSKLHERQIHR